MLSLCGALTRPAEFLCSAEVGEAGNFARLAKFYAAFTFWTAQIVVKSLLICYNL